MSQLLTLSSRAGHWISRRIQLYDELDVAQDGTGKTLLLVIATGAGVPVPDEDHGLDVEFASDEDRLAGIVTLSGASPDTAGVYLIHVDLVDDPDDENEIPHDWPEARSITLTVLAA